MNNSSLSKLKNAIRSAAYIVLGKLSPKAQMSWHYKTIYKRKLNWDSPRTIDEKICWLKLYSDTTLWSQYTDKYTVRQHVSDVGLGHLLVNLYGKWEKPEDIEWEKLPQQFIIKSNNGSGEVLICKDKANADYNQLTKRVRSMMNRKTGSHLYEPHYDAIRPYIIAEELLDTSRQPFGSTSIADYKVWAFDGKPAYIWVCYDRNPHSVKCAVYDTDWNFHPEHSVSTPHYILSDLPIPKPECLQQMLDAASCLSKGFPELRCDFYVVDGKLYFGEMTFTAAAGFNYFYSLDFREELGNLCTIKE